MAGGRRASNMMFLHQGRGRWFLNLITPVSIRLNSNTKPTISTGFCVGLAFVLVALLTALNIAVGIGLSDEGYLWYGTWRTMLGEVPILDFRGYDPGRYYWGAAWGLLFGDGIIGLRLSNALFAFGGLSFGLLAARLCPSDMHMPSGYRLWHRCDLVKPGG
jgi:hypothetical protein